MSEAGTSFNPGSVGVPLDGEHSASYMILDGDGDGWTLAAHRRVPFDLAPLLAEYERQDFVARCGVTGALIVAEFRTARLQVLPYLVWKESHYPGPGRQSRTPARIPRLG